MLFSIKNHGVVVKKVHNGVTLMETLVALSLGSLILFLAGGVYSEFYLLRYQQREISQLQKNAHQIINYLQQHILNAGYQGVLREESNFTWFQPKNRAYHLEANCLIVMRDSNGDGCLGTRVKKQCRAQTMSVAKEISKEMLAVKLEGVDLMVAGKQNHFTPCYAEQCAMWLKSCQHWQWEKIASLSDNRIEKLHFSWEKPDQLIKIELTLGSLKNNMIKYHTTAYAYLLNGE